MKTRTFLLAAMSMLATVVACGGGAVNSAADSAATATATPMNRPAANAEVSERSADSAQAVGVPSAVADVGNHGEDLYDQLTAGNWTNARTILDSLDTSVAALSAGDRAQLAPVIDTLRRAVASRNRNDAIEAANRVTFVDANLTEAYHPKLPADIVRLDYYGRELQIWAARGDMARLATTSADLQRTWTSVKSNEISHGGAAAAARTDSLIARITSAKTPAEYAKVATAFLDVVDQLEKPFE